MTQEEHDALVSVIRGVHEKLRFSYQTTGDQDKVWKDHCADKKTRQEYAASMLRLATTVWPYKDRIEWCHQTVRDYFYEGGLERSLRRHYRKLGLEYSEHVLNCAKRSLNLGGGERLHLLDVGSCYNPFAVYADIETVAIDLTPADDGTLECDFLKLQVTKHHCGPSELRSYLTTPLVSLPEKSFHAVVFCLVLEYLPSCLQRWTFCRKAAALLKPNGLLLVVTPDSKHQQRNAPMIASWKEALEELSFTRVRYEKRQHLHCMAFRKEWSLEARATGGGAEDDYADCSMVDNHTTDCMVREIVLDDMTSEEVFLQAQKLYIPQDSRDYAALFATSIVQERTEMDDNALREAFSALPCTAD